MNRLSFLLFSFLLFSCVSPAQPAQTEPVTVHATASAQPWLGKLFACANARGILLDVTIESAEIQLRLGEPQTLPAPAYQIGEEEILVATHRESPIQNVSMEEVQDLFAGRGDDSVQVWVYASGTDVQIAFDQLVMKGRSVTSFARVAANPQEMSAVLNSESNAVGIIPGHWLAGNVREVYSAGRLPVLALTNQESRGEAQALIGCLQND